MSPGADRLVRLPARSAMAVLGLLLLAASIGLGVWLTARAGQPFAVDLHWNAFLVGAWSPIVSVGARVMDFLGGGWFGVFVVPLGIAAVFVIRRRPWPAVAFLAAEAASAGVVQILKHAFGRARPEEIVVVSDFGSYPSGHVANAATIATFLIVLSARAWVIVVGSAWVLLMAFSRTYLHAHWLSDTLGGALAGAGAALVVAAIFARPLLRGGQVSG